MQRRYWRRVYAFYYDGKGWRLASDGWQWAWNAFECIFGDTWCNPPQPFIYEQWWYYVPATWGGEDVFTYLGARVNWGSNPVVQ